MKKNSLGKKEKRIKIVMRISYVLLGIAVLFLILATGYMGYYVIFVEDLYRAFKINFISGIFGYTGIFFICLYFLYLMTVITFINPQKLKKSKRAKFTVVGIVILFLTIWFLNFSVTEISMEAKDMKAYANGDWIIKDLEVKHVDRTPGFSMAYIKTEDGELLLYRRVYSTEPGKVYRITYLENTKTVIRIIPISNEE